MNKSIDIPTINGDSNLFSCNIVIAIIISNIFFTYPSVLSLFLPIPSPIIITPIYTCLYLIILVKKIRIQRQSHLLWQCFTIQLATWIILAIINKDSIYLTRSIFLINGFLAINCLWNYSNAFSQFQIIYIKLIAFLGTSGVISFILVLVGFLIPFFTYENLDGREGEFFGLTCTNARLGNVIRYAGIFDEPGAMAFWGIMALIINEFSYQNRTLERIIMICLIFTFSMAYYIQIFFYIIIFKIKTINQGIKLMAIIFILISGVLITKDSEFDLYTPTIMRFEMNDHGELKGDNRSNAAMKAKNYFISSPFIGHGPSITTAGDYMADNQYENLATDGIIGTVVMYLPLLILIIHPNKKVLGGLFILALGYMQRPFHQNFMHAFMLYVLSYTFLKYKNNLQYVK